MTQLESARKGVTTPEMIRVALRENTTPEFIRDHVAAGRIVIPANVRHLVGSGGQAEGIEGSRDQGIKEKGNGDHRLETGATISNPQSAIRNPQLAYPTQSTGHPNHRPGSALWVNQTVNQRRKWLDDPQHMTGALAAKRLDPIGIGRPITTKINANIGASPVSSDTREEVEKLRWAALYGADTLMDLSTGGKLDECRQAIIDNATIPIGTVPIYSMIIGRNIEDLTYDDILRTVEHQARQGVDYFTIHAGVLRELLPLI